MNRTNRPSCGTLFFLFYVLLFGFVLAINAQTPKLIQTDPCQPVIVTTRLCSDTIQAAGGDLRITPIYHASLVLEFAGKTIYVDPVTRMRGSSGLKNDLSSLPKADLILITDIHDDHMERGAIDQVKKASTIIVAPRAVAATITEAQVIANGESKDLAGFKIEAIPMYNVTRGPKPGEVYHDKGRGNGYILTVGGKRLYFSGDTDGTPEMKALKNIDVAFICMNSRQTMTPSEAAETVKAFRPKILYPYHFGDSSLPELADALRDAPGVEMRIRKWY